MTSQIPSKRDECVPVCLFGGELVGLMGFD